MDYSAQVGEGYVLSSVTDRKGRVQQVLKHSSSSVIYSAVSMLGASAALMFAYDVFAIKLGIMLFATASFSLLWSQVFMPALLLTPFGPQGSTGMLPTAPFLHRCLVHCTSKRRRSISKRLRRLNKVHSIRASTASAWLERDD